MEIRGQVAIVTGGGSGLGRAMAKGLARNGAKVLLADVRKEAGEKVLNEIRESGGNGLRTGSILLAALRSPRHPDQ